MGSDAQLADSVVVAVAVAVAVVAVAAGNVVAVGRIPVAVAEVGRTGLAVIR